MATSQRGLGDEDYRRLLDLRDGLRLFLRWSAREAEAVGLTAGQHQLLLVVRAHENPRGPTIGEAADHLLLRHHSVVELVDRAEASGLIRRRSDPSDRRVVRLRLTPLGRRRLEGLSTLHVEELRRLARRLRPMWEGLGGAR
jgi:DNA-binding MarR family transcriptional regulator